MSIIHHTPGPWKVIGKNDTQVCSSAIQGASGYVVARAYHSPSAKIPYKDLWAECEANARLIAAAPQLLRELKSAIFYIETYGGEVTTSFASGGNLRAIKQLIAEAEGRG